MSTAGGTVLCCTRSQKGCRMARIVWLTLPGHVGSRGQDVWGMLAWVWACALQLQRFGVGVRNAVCGMWGQGSVVCGM